MSRARRRAFPLWVKVAYTAFVAVLVPVYWRVYGPQNFLWFSDIALFTVTAALWMESRLLASMMALAVFVPEVVWNVDFFTHLITGRSPINLAGYMFDGSIPLGVRGLSLFHVALPPTLAWMLYRLGYDRRALPLATGLAWVVFPVTYVLTTPEQNINWVYGLGKQPQAWMPAWAWVGLLMVVFPLCVYLPLHVLFRRAFARAHGRGRRSDHGL